MQNPFAQSLDNKRYHTLNYYLKHRFGEKVAKIPLSLATTCPNRDGTVGVGGCSFCSAEGGGGVPASQTLTLEQEYQRNLSVVQNKWANSLTIPYFQSYTNTHLPLSVLKGAINQALCFPRAVGISLATRPDALPEPVLDYLAELSTRTYLVVELGLQTIHAATAQRINRCHSLEQFDHAYHALRERGVSVCIHLINGLPLETHEMMVQTARYAGSLAPHAIKLHMLHLVAGTRLAEEYQARPFPLLTREEYVAVLCDQLELLPAETIIERITGDPMTGELVAPLWTLDKLWVRNALDKELLRRNCQQGCRVSL